MVSTSDVQQAIFIIIFVFSSILANIATNKGGVYDTLVVYFPWIVQFYGAKMSVFLALLAMGSMIAVILIQEFNEQDKPI